MIRKVVATHRLKKLRHLHAVEKLATWRRTYGFDRLEDSDDHWVHGLLSLTPEQITASMWSDQPVKTCDFDIWKIWVEAEEGKEFH